MSRTKKIQNMNNDIHNRYAKHNCKKLLCVLLRLLLAIETIIGLATLMKGVLSLRLRTPFFETFCTPRFLLIPIYFTNDNTVCKILTHNKCGTFIAHDHTRSCDAAARCSLLTEQLVAISSLVSLLKKKDSTMIP